MCLKYIFFLVFSCDFLIFAFLQGKLHLSMKRSELEEYFGVSSPDEGRKKLFFAIMSRSCLSPIRTPLLIL